MSLSPPNTFEAQMRKKGRDLGITTFSGAAEVSNTDTAKILRLLSSSRSEDLRRAAFMNDKLPTHFTIPINGKHLVTLVHPCLLEDATGKAYVVGSTTDSIENPQFVAIVAEEFFAYIPCLVDEESAIKFKLAISDTKPDMVPPKGSNDEADAGMERLQWGEKAPVFACLPLAIPCPPKFFIDPHPLDDDTLMMPFTYEPVEAQHKALVHLLQHGSGVASTVADNPMFNVTMIDVSKFTHFKLKHCRINATPLTNTSSMYPPAMAHFQERVTATYVGLALRQVAEAGGTPGDKTIASGGAINMEVVKALKEGITEGMVRGLSGSVDHYCGNYLTGVSTMFWLPHQSRRRKEPNTRPSPCKTRRPSSAVSMELCDGSCSLPKSFPRRAFPQLLQPNESSSPN